jgi:hypothetical protein
LSRASTPYFSVRLRLQPTKGVDPRDKREDDDKKGSLLYRVPDFAGAGLRRLGAAAR